MSDILNKLKEPFPEKLIHWRVGAMTKDKKKGIALAYIDARHVMKRLDDVVGFQNWQDDYEETKTGRVICKLSIKLPDALIQEWISKCDGAGETDVEGQKGAISDAFKRAAVKWGIGRYLYALGTTWVDLDDYKKIITPPKLPKWALPKE